MQLNGDDDLDHSDYGLVWNRVLETGNLLVGDSVDLVLGAAGPRRWGS